MKSNREKYIPYLLISPFLLSFCIFFLFPSIYSFVLSFTNYKGYGDFRFIGFRNYVANLKYQLFWMSLRNIFFYFFMHAIPVMAISFSLALVMHSGLIGRSSVIYKPIIFTPYMIAIVASALVWRIMLSTRYGVINSLLKTTIPFLEDPNIMRWSVVLLIIWRSVGWFFVIFLAGLTTINDDILDAARIDGASYSQRLWHIVLPLMKPIFKFAFFVDIINSMKIFTEPVVLMSSGQTTPAGVSTVMQLLVNNMKGGNFGKASSIGWTLFVVILIVAFFQYRIFTDRSTK
jgi:ABC-type sugar transport system permease subunit